MVGQHYVGYVLIKSITPQKDPNSRVPLKGTMHYKGKTLPFKVWKGNLQDYMNENHEKLEGKVFLADVVVESYLNKVDLLLKNAQETNDRTEVDFYESVDYEGLFQELILFTQKNMSSKSQGVLNALFSNGDFADKFKKTWAGERMHDAVVGGLLNHTMKMLRIARTLQSNDTRLDEYADLIYLSIIVHDIGKIEELGVDGSYKENSFYGHRMYGVERVMSIKQEIITTYGEKFYYHLQSVVQGHHGEYGDEPVTAWAYIVHLIDMLESQLTHVLDSIHNGDIGYRAGETTVWTNGKNLPFELE